MISPELSKILCLLFGIVNLMLGAALLSELNLMIAMLMFITVIYYEYVGI